ncbi:nuclear transport factor 2 family protein [Nocardia sp. 004]|uniref:nuclear transport factor 2 family protein n=1 Tax=Nocardia sp. 004 TaxID=3385978 RepID=UPI0039A360AF
MAVAVAAALDIASGTATAAPQSLDTTDTAIARAYVDALASHDATDVPFAPDATRVENGVPTGFSGPQLTRSLEHGPESWLIQRTYDLDMTQTGDVVTAHYLIDIGIGDTPWITLNATENFTIRDGLIQSMVATLVPAH